MVRRYGRYEAAEADERDCCVFGFHDCTLQGADIPHPSIDLRFPRHMDVPPKSMIHDH